MSYPSDDLAPLFGGGPAAGAGLSQGVIRAWDPDTFANTIDWNGTALTDVPVLNAADALTYRPGDVVNLIGTGGPVGSWAILGRLVTPGTGRGQAAIDYMTNALARDLAAQVFADRIESATVQTSQSTSSTSFTNLATTGPTVTLDITSSGIALVFLSADMLAAGETCHMSFQVSGASSVAPSFDRSLSMSSDAAVTGSALGGSSSKIVPVTGLNPGTHTFQAKYASVNGNPAWFSKRSIVVIGL